MRGDSLRCTRACTARAPALHARLPHAPVRHGISTCCGIRGKRLHTRYPQLRIHRGFSGASSNGLSVIFSNNLTFQRYFPKDYHLSSGFSLAFSNGFSFYEIWREISLALEESQREKSRRGSPPDGRRLRRASRPSCRGSPARPGWRHTWPGPRLHPILLLFGVFSLHHSNFNG